MARAYLVEISISFVEVDSKTAPTCREVLQFVRDEDGAEYCCIDDDEEGCTCWNRREIIQDPHHSMAWFGQGKHISYFKLHRT